jgi:hypothetical protein
MPAVFWLWNARSGKLDRLTGLRTTAGLAGLAAAFVVIEAAVLEAVNVTFSYGRLLHTAVPGQTGNMWFNFDLSAANLEDRLTLDLSLLPGKLAGHLAEQLFAFDDMATAVFFWTFNLLVGVALVMAWRARRQRSRLLVIAVSIGLVGVHLLTITLFQNQVRYTLPAIPGLLVVLAMALSAVAPLDRLMRARPLAITLGILLVAALPAGALARVARDDAAANAAVEREAMAALDRHLPPTERLLIVYDDTPQVLAYAARPRLVLYLWPEYTQEQLAELVDRFGATWLLAPLDAPLLSRLGQPVPDQVETIERPGSPWGLYRLDPP